MSTRRFATWFSPAPSASFVPYLILRLVLRKGVAVLFVRLLRFVRVLRNDPSRILDKALTVDATVASFWRERPGAFIAILFVQIGARLVSWRTCSRRCA